MANVFTDFAALQNTARNDQSAAPNLRQAGGNVHFLNVTKTGYTAATADPLFIARLPKGAILMPSLCSVDYTDPGDALTGSIGYYTAQTDTPAVVSAAAFGTALALGAAAGRKGFVEAGTLGVALITPIQFTTDVWIVATWTTATVAVSHTQTWHLAYTLA